MKNFCILVSIVVVLASISAKADLIKPNAASISYRGRFDLSNINTEAWYVINFA